jgi:hypothetical protein
MVFELLRFWNCFGQTKLRTTQQSYLRAFLRCTSRRPVSLLQAEDVSLGPHTGTASRSGRGSGAPRNYPRHERNEQPAEGRSSGLRDGSFGAVRRIRLYDLKGNARLWAEACSSCSNTRRPVLCASARDSGGGPTAPRAGDLRSARLRGSRRTSKRFIIRKAAP